MAEYFQIQAVKTFFWACVVCDVGYESVGQSASHAVMSQVELEQCDSMLIGNAYTCIIGNDLVVIIT